VAAANGPHASGKEHGATERHQAAEANAHQHSGAAPLFEKGLQPGAPRGDCRGGGPAGRNRRSRSGRGHRRPAPPSASGPAVRAASGRCHSQNRDQQQGGWAWIPQAAASGQTSLPPCQTMFAPSMPLVAQAGRGLVHNRSRSDAGGTLNYCDFAECVSAAAFFSRPAHGRRGNLGVLLARQLAAAARWGARPDGRLRHFRRPCATARKAKAEVGVGPMSRPRPLSIDFQANLPSLRLRLPTPLRVQHTHGPKPAGRLPDPEEWLSSWRLDGFGRRVPCCPCPRCGQLSGGVLLCGQQAWPLPPRPPTGPRDPACWGCRPGPSSQAGVWPCACSWG